MPFRSETEHIREQVRRLDEQAVVLREEQVDLERQVASQAPKRGRLVLILAAVGVLAGAMGYGAGILRTSTQLTHQREMRAREHAVDVDSARTLKRECERTERATSMDVIACMADLARARSAPTISSVSPSPSDPSAPTTAGCRCRDGDPRCTCPFDRASALRALKGAQPNVIDCIKPSRKVRFHTQLSFATSGATNNVEIDSNADQLSAAERTCVVAVLRGIKVPQFGGGPIVIVGMTYTTAPYGGEDPAP